MAYKSVIFDVGPRGRVALGDYALLNGGPVICDAAVEVGDHCLVSWNVLLMDTYRWPTDPADRRRELRRVAGDPARRLPAAAPARPVRFGSNVWVGFDACVLPGVTVGEGAILGARSVVTEDVPPYSVAMGNPARVACGSI